MTMADPTRDVRPPTLRNSTYEGYAIEVNDDKMRQRVRIRIPVLHRDIPDNKLPWANPQFSGTANAGSGVGQVNVPAKFSKLIVTFPDDDPHTPQYSASPTSDDVNKDNELLKNDYPNTYGSVDSYGNRVSTNRATGEMTIAHRSGTTVYIDGSGNVTIASAGDLSIASKNNISINAGGRMNLSAQGDIVMNGANVHFNEGSATPPNIPGARPTPNIPDMSGKTNL